MRTSACSLACAALLLPALAAATAAPPPSKSKKPCATPPPKPPKHFVTSEKLQDLITIDGLLAGAQKLQSFADANGGTRAFGSGGHSATVDYLVDTLSATNYYNVTKQPFTALYSSGKATLTADGGAIEAKIMTYTPGGAVEGVFVPVANLGCDAADYPAEVAGNVALISRGTCTFAEKSTAAKAAGAGAAVIYNNAEGTVSGTLGEPFGAYAPVVGITQADGQAILAAIEANGAVQARLAVDAVTEERVTFNVIAETKTGDHDNVLVLGGHTDSVSDGPGINDDGSGTIGVLNVAVALSKFKVKNAVRFGFWSAEEFGLLGSYAYVNSLNGSETELAKLRAYLNFDMVSSFP